MHRSLQPLLLALLLVAGATALQAQYADPIWIRGGNPTPVVSLVYSPNGQFIASVGFDGAIKVWDIASSRVYRTFIGANATSVSFFPDNTKLASGSVDGTVKIWNINTGAQVLSFAGHNGKVSGVAVTSNGASIATAGGDNLAKLFNATTGVVQQTFTGHTGPVLSVSLSADGQKVLTGAQDKSVRLWNAANGSLVRTWNDTNSRSYVVISDDGKYIAYAGGQCFFTSTGCGVNIYDANTGAEVKRFTGGSGPHRLDVQGVAYSSNGKYIASAGLDGNVYVYRADSVNLTPAVRIRHAFGPRAYAAANACRFSPDNKYLASGGDDKVLRIWDITTGSSSLIVDSSNAVTSVAYVASANKVASGRRDGIVTVREATTGNITRIFSSIDSSQSPTDGRWTYIAGSSIDAVAFNSGATRLAIARADYSVIVIDPTTGSVIKKFDVGSQVSSIRYSPDGTKLLTGHRDNAVKTWNSTSGAPDKTFSAHTAAVTSVLWSSDGTKIISGSDDRTIKIWDATTANVIRTLEGHSGSVVALALSSDGKYLASADADTIRVWGFPAGTHYSTASGHGAAITALAFSADNSWVLSTSRDGAVKVWRPFSGYNSYTYGEYEGEGLTIALDGDHFMTGTSDGQTIYWPVKTGTTTGELASPMLISPADQATNVPSPFYTTWGRVAGTVLYDLQISTENTFTTGLVVNRTEIPDSTLVQAALATGTVNYWRVRATSPTANSAWTAPWKFTTAGNTQLDVPKLKLPADGTTNTPLTLTLEWESAVGAEFYALQVSTESGFGTKFLDSTHVDGTSFTVNGLVKNTTYYWRARSKNSIPKQTNFSTAWTFTTTAVTSVDPENGTSANSILRSVQPNPVGAIGSVLLHIERAGDVRVRIVDALGRDVATLHNGAMDAGDRIIGFDATRYNPGVYFVQVETNGHVETARINVVW